MNKIQEQVKEFHKAFDIFESRIPIIPTMKVRELRIALIEEELAELKEGFAKRDLIEIADAIGDILYVTFGAAISCGIDIEPIMDEIHRSNMSKVGGHKAKNGKWIKPDTYSPANLEPILVSQSEAVWNKKGL